MNIIIIGSGNVASVLGQRMTDAGHTIGYLWGRNFEKASRLAAALGAELLSGDWVHWPQDADLVFVSVSDDAYAVLATALPPTEMMVLHSGGSVPINIFQNVASRTGVLYPLQSIRPETKHPELPLLIDSSRPEDLAFLRSFALSLSPMVTRADDETRIRYHVAAVFAANFANHLFALAEAYCAKEGLDFSFLRPLLEETVMRMRNNSPAGLQTGPAVRGDTGTIQKHLLLLKDEPAMAAIYNLLTKSIMDFYS